MERHDFPVSGEAERWVQAAEHGADVYLTRDGKAVARVQAATAEPKGSLNPAALLELRAALADIRVADGAALIRELRDSSDH